MQNPISGQSPACLIKDEAVVENQWTLIDKTGDAASVALAEGKIIVPLAVWQAQRQQLLERGEIGVWLDSDETADRLGEDAVKLSLIAINFPTFMDGRGFTCARLLRERYHYRGELRAIGYILRDQLFYLKRCGFNAFSFNDGTDLQQTVKSLNDFSESYQAAVDQPIPLFRRRT